MFAILENCSIKILGIQFKSVGRGRRIPHCTRSRRSHLQFQRSRLRHLRQANPRHQRTHPRGHAQFNQYHSSLISLLGLSAFSLSSATIRPFRAPLRCGAESFLSALNPSGTAATGRSNKHQHVRKRSTISFYFLQLLQFVQFLQIGIGFS